MHASELRNVGNTLIYRTTTDMNYEKVEINFRKTLSDRAKHDARVETFLERASVLPDGVLRMYHSRPARTLTGAVPEKAPRRAFPNFLENYSKYVIECR